MKSTFARLLRAAGAVGTAAALLAGCAGDDLAGPAPPRPADVRAQLVQLMPAGTADRDGWAVDVYAAFAALQIPPTASNLCAAIAITEQESSFNADPPVPNLGRIAWEEIDRRAERIGVPKLALHLALKLNSPDGRSYAQRIDAVKTERELSGIFEDFIAMVPLGSRLFAGYNPVRTGGPMQVGIGFAEQQSKTKAYPYPTEASVRHEVFTRRGGLYYGIAHLLDYPAPYDKPLYRFADFNAGRYASRNAAFQNAVAIASGIPLELDGDLLRHDDDADAKPGATELAVRTLGRQLAMDDAAIRRALAQGDGAAFSRSALHEQVFALAERLDRRELPRAVVPRIDLKSPKIKRKLTTEWFASRVDERHRRCMSRGAQTPLASTLRWPGR